MDGNSESTVGRVDKVKKEEFYLKMKSKSSLREESDTDAMKGRKTKMELELKTKCTEKVKPRCKEERMDKCQEDGGKSMKAKKQAKMKGDKSEEKKKQKGVEERNDLNAKGVGVADEVGKLRQEGKSAVQQDKDDQEEGQTEDRRKLNCKDKDPEIGRLKEKLEKINARIEALLEKKAEIMMQIKEAESNLLTV
ncbi:hypothetical protein SAY86_028746 [Trapa natans]|uniref:Uncharacterized protein n=1 Tax=Trapa natans TaxID=22666 RepID=A0AAN7MFY6_TRANT|nr:hypothetical protein SAY86_028746 [Trapa natans]